MIAERWQALLDQQAKRRTWLSRGVVHLNITAEEAEGDEPFARARHVASMYVFRFWHLLFSPNRW